jgi:hypothetical protein
VNNILKFIEMLIMAMVGIEAFSESQPPIRAIDYPGEEVCANGNLALGAFR